MINENNGIVLRPFGPSIAKVTIPPELVKKLNEYVDKTIEDEQKSKKLDMGHALAGNVKQEFKLEKEIMESSGWAKFLVNNTSQWISSAINRKISTFNLIDSWVVRQFENDYNPLHMHGGHISGVGYLKVPKSFGEYSQKTKEVNKNGTLTLVYGSEAFLAHSTFSVTPKVGDFYFFPHYMMHVVYPFKNSNEERRSISFNAKIDEDIFSSYKE
tara:strand:+ start:484 stop:1125 length:642 start_codon:yes stop_codon:yes gene_type:complete